jgi:hypothetical protein
MARLDGASPTFGFLDEVIDEVEIAGNLAAADHAIAIDLAGVHRFQGHHGFLVAGVELDQTPGQGGFGLDQGVAQEQQKRLAPDVIARVAHRVPQIP